MVFVDPPYNVPIAGHVCGLGTIQHENFAMAAGELSEAEFTQYLRTLFAHLVAHSQEGAIHFICMDWRHLYELLTAARAVYTALKNVCVWKKTNGGMGTFYRSQHELVLVAKQGTQPHINNFELGQHGRYRTNVWEYPGNNAFHEGRLDELVMHPTVKPVALVADAIKDCSHRGGIILDCCVGSGTTVIAAEQTGRTAYGMELDPRYVDTILHRWQAYTNQDATHAVTGRTFSEVGKERGHAAAS
jgi:16S rRNA G966 N2-methylase RsmD